MHEVKSIQDLLNQISRDEILLAEFQRGYVWNRDQVRGLMQSLYRKHPTGHLLIWRTYKPSLASSRRSRQGLVYRSALLRRHSLRRSLRLLPRLAQADAGRPIATARPVRSRKPTVAEDGRGGAG